MLSLQELDQEIQEFTLRMQETAVELLWQRNIRIMKWRIRNLPKSHPAFDKIDELPEGFSEQELQFRKEDEEKHRDEQKKTQELMAEIDKLFRDNIDTVERCIEVVKFFGSRRDAQNEMRAIKVFLPKIARLRDLLSVVEVINDMNLGTFYALKKHCSNNAVFIEAIQKIIKNAEQHKKCFADRQFIKELIQKAPE